MRIIYFSISINWIVYSIFIAISEQLSSKFDGRTAVQRGEAEGARRNGVVSVGGARQSETESGRE